MGRRSGSGNIGLIIEGLFLLIRLYSLWILFPEWVHAPLQVVMLYYTATYYIKWIPTFYNDAMDGFIDVDDGWIILLECSVAFIVPILFYFLYINTLNKLYGCINGLVGYFVHDRYHQS